MSYPSKSALDNYVTKVDDYVALLDAAAHANTGGNDTLEEFTKATLDAARADLPIDGLAPAEAERIGRADTRVALADTTYMIRRASC
jgi:hypothetical protein